MGDVISFEKYRGKRRGTSRHHYGVEGRFPHRTEGRNRRPGFVRLDAVTADILRRLTE